MSRATAALTLIAALVLAPGCGEKPAPPPPDPGPETSLTPPVVPALAVLAPASATLGGPAFVLHATGERFDGASVVLWNGLPLTTRVGSATTIEADVPAGALERFGAAK